MRPILPHFAGLYPTLKGHLLSAAHANQTKAWIWLGWRSSKWILIPGLRRNCLSSFESILLVCSSRGNLLRCVGISCLFSCVTCFLKVAELTLHLNNFRWILVSNLTIHWPPQQQKDVLITSNLLLSVIFPIPYSTTSYSNVRSSPALQCPRALSFFLWTWNAGYFLGAKHLSSTNSMSRGRSTQVAKAPCFSGVVSAAPPKIATHPHGPTSRSYSARPPPSSKHSPGELPRAPDYSHGLPSRPITTMRSSISILFQGERLFFWSNPQVYPHQHTHTQYRVALPPRHSWWSGPVLGLCSDAALQIRVWPPDASWAFVREFSQWLRSFYKGLGPCHRDISLGLPTYKNRFSSKILSFWVCIYIRTGRKRCFALFSLPPDSSRTT